MAHITLMINGRSFGMECDDGQEQRVRELGHYVDAKIRSISASGGATNENHLLVLTSLMLTNEIFELRDQLGAMGEQIRANEDWATQETAVAQMIETLSERIDLIANRIQNA